MSQEEAAALDEIEALERKRARQEGRPPPTADELEEKRPNRIEAIREMLNEEARGTDARKRRIAEELLSGLSKERRNYIGEFLQAKWDKCPMCGEDEFYIGDKILGLPAGSDALFPVATVVCTNCSFTALVNVMHADLFGGAAGHEPEND